MVSQSNSSDNFVQYHTLPAAISYAIELHKAKVQVQVGSESAGFAARCFWKGGRNKASF